MSWATPRSWAAGETETAAIFNTHLRDQQNVIATARDSIGRVRRALKTVAFGTAWIASTNANAAGGADTVLSGMSCSIPANTWANPGDCLIVEAYGFVPGNNANVKTLKIRVGGATAVTLTTGAFVQNTSIAIRAHLIRNSVTNIGVYGCTRFGLGTGGTATNVINSGSFTVANVTTNALTFDFLCASATAADIGIVEYALYSSLSLTGAVV